MSSSINHALHYVPEVTYGTTPANPAWVGLRKTGANIGLTREMVISNEIRSDRQIKCGHLGNKTGGGEITGELAPLDFDALILSAMCCAAWAARVAPYTASTISADAADNSYNDSANLFPLLLPGDKFTVSGFTGAVGNNQAVFVVSRTAGKIIVSGGVALVNDAAGEAVTITCNTITAKPGTTRSSVSLLRHFTDIEEAGEPFHVIPGVDINNLALTFALGANVTASFAAIARDYIPDGTAPAGSTYTPAGSICPFNSLAGTILEGGDVLGIASEVSLTLENGMEPRPVLMSTLTKKPSIGKASVTGSLTVYFETSALLQKFLSETTSSLSVTVESGAWRYNFYLPSIKYIGAQPDVEGVADITLTMPFQAFLDSTAETNFAISKTQIA